MKSADSRLEAEPFFAEIQSENSRANRSGSKNGIIGVGFLAGIIVIALASAVTAHKIDYVQDAVKPKSGNADDTLWEKTGGPPGIQTNVIFKANNIVYAGTETQGVYRSTDNGLNWVAANAGIERASISELIMSGGNLLAAAKSTCVNYLNTFKSTDNGATWTGTTGLGGNVVNSFAIKGSVVWATFFALPSNSGIARSTDNGNTWQVVSSPITDAGESIVSGNAIIVAEDNFIWRSTDDGASWDVVEQFNLTGTSSFARAGTKLFGASTSGIETSTDNGASWSFEAFSDGAYSFSANGNTIFLGSNNKVFKSTDFGATWIDMSVGLGKGGIQALLYDGSTLFAGTPADAVGIYRSTNGGANWQPAAAGLPVASVIRSQIAFGGYVFAGTNGDGIYRSSDHGNTWVKTDVNNSLLAQQLVLDFCAKDNALYAGAGNGIYKSTDSGATFQRILNGFPPNHNVTAYSLTLSSGNIVAAVSVSFSPSDVLQTIFYSPDDGSTWHQANLPIEPTFVSAVASDGTSRAYAGVYGQSFSVTGLYQSTNGGITWVSRTDVLEIDIERLAVKGSNVLASTLFTAFFSTDFGETWGSSTPGICPFGCGIATYTLSGTSIFAGNTAGMFLSTDSGATWADINEGFPTCPIPVAEASCVDNVYLFAGTFGEAVWRKSLNAPFVLSSAVSRKAHGAAGSFDIDLPVSDAPGIESRSGGATNDYQLVLTFANPVSVNGNPQAQVTLGTGVVGSGGISNGGMVTINGNTVTVPLTNVANAQLINVTLYSINGGGNLTIPMKVLIGDTNANSTVNAGDVAQTKSQIGQSVGSTNFRTDVNATGTINATDVAIIKSHLGSGVP